MDSQSWILLALGAVLVLFCLPMAFMRGRRGNANTSGDAAQGGSCSQQAKPQEPVDQAKHRH